MTLDPFALSRVSVIGFMVVITYGYRFRNTVELCFSSTPKEVMAEWCGRESDTSDLDVVAWRRLAVIAQHVIQRQNTLELLQCSGHPRLFTIVIYYDDIRWRVARLLEDTISDIHRSISFVYFETSGVNISHSLDEVNAYNSDLINVVFITDALNVFTESLDYVMSNSNFRWTALRHVTEWFIVSNLDLFQVLDGEYDIPDFVTLVFSDELDTVSIAQKSRKQRMKRVSKLREDTWSVLNSCLEATSDTDVSSQCQELDREMEARDATGSLRLNGWLHLRTERSVMDGMHITVPMFTTAMDFRPGDDTSVTVSENLAAEILSVMAQSLGFTYQKILVEDGGYYGAVKPNGITGITGLLARREAALSIIPLSMIDNRRGYIDFVPYPTTLETNKLIYMLPSSAEHLDLTFVEIVSPDFVLFLLGPLFAIGIVGAVVHLATRSCTLVAPLPVRWKDIIMYKMEMGTMTLKNIGVP